MHDVLQDARLKTRVSLLDTLSRIEDYERRFREGSGVRRLEEEEYRRGARGLRLLPRDDPRAEAAAQRVLPGEGRGRTHRLRDRQRGPSGLQPADRGPERGARERRRPLDEAGKRGGAEPRGRRRADHRLLRAPRSSDRRLPARAPGARRSRGSAGASWAARARSSRSFRRTRPTSTGTRSPSPTR